MTAALACRSCSWFGVYRTDVANSLAGCPNCGADSLDVRDLEDPAWGQVGGELLAELQRPAGAREDSQP